jgi:hypothetical protein
VSVIVCSILTVLEIRTPTVGILRSPQNPFSLTLLHRRITSSLARDLIFLLSTGPQVFLAPSVSSHIYFRNGEDCPCNLSQQEI